MKLFIIGSISPKNPNAFLRKIKICNQKNPAFIIPEYFFMNPYGILQLLFLQIKCYFELNVLLSRQNKSLFRGLDINLFLKQEIDNLFYRGEIRTNLCNYLIAKNYNRFFQSNYLTLFFENHNWERLTYIACRKFSPRTMTIGYQHSSILLREINYFISKYETDIAPLPKKIITVGKETKHILEKYGSYPSGMITAGCALRYEYLFATRLKPRFKQNVILVAFSIDFEGSEDFIRSCSKFTK